MPLQEAPTGLCESSPESSLSTELAAQEDAFPAAAPPQVQIQIRVQTPPEPAAPFHDILRLQHGRQRQWQRLPRIGSYDRDIAAAEADNYGPPPPAAVHLLPVVLPTQVAEPTLDELLRRVTERTDLQNVDSVRLRVISYTVSLSRLSLFMPRLQHLDLSGSVLNTLRDLGYGLLHLAHLNVSNCGLQSFDGVSGLPAVRVLHADGNMIQRVGPLAELPLLQRLSAQQNRISDLGLLTFLGMCPNLVEVDLRGNPVCHLTLYRITLRRSVSSLQLLDGLPLDQATSTTAVTTTDAAVVDCRSHSSTDDGELSSLSSEATGGGDYETLELSAAASGAASLEMATSEATRQRPATAPSGHEGHSGGSISDTITVNLQQPRRPATVSEAMLRGNAISMGGTAPVVGSVLGWARRNRQRRPNGHAWASSSSSSVSFSSSSSPSSSIASTRPPSAYSSSGSLDLQSQNAPKD